MIGAVGLGCAVGATVGVLTGYVCDKIGKAVGKIWAGDSTNAKEETKAGVWGSRILQGAATFLGPLAAYGLVRKFNPSIQLQRFDIIYYPAEYLERFMEPGSRGFKTVKLEAVVVAFSLAIIVRGIFLEAHRTHENIKKKLVYGFAGVGAAVSAGAVLFAAGYVPTAQALSIHVLKKVLLTQKTVYEGMRVSAAMGVVALVLIGSLSYTLGAYIAAQDPTKKD